MHMKTFLLGSTAAAALILTSTTFAHAAHFNGWYLGIEGGASWIGDTDVVFNDVTLPPPDFAVASAEFDTGWAAFGTLGYAWNNWRLEFELGYRDNEIDALTPTFDPGGVFFGGKTFSGADLTEFSQMVNIVYDWRFSDRWSLSLGAGVGGDLINLETNTTPNPAFTVDDDDYVFAWQLLAGLNYAIGQRTDLFVNYRYFNADEPSFDGFNGGGAPILIDIDDLEKHTLTIGLRFDLSPDEVRVAAPPPQPAPEPPPPPAAPPPPQEFVVTFAPNKANLTAEAQQTISAAAEQARQTGSATIRIEGDGSRSLTKRRVNAVRSALANQGIPAGSINASGQTVEITMSR